MTSTPSIAVMFGIALLVAGAVFNADRVRLIADGVWTNARVITLRMEETGSRPNRTFDYHAVIAYRVREADFPLERSWQVKEGGRCYSPCPAAGDMVRVRYLPDDPRTAEIDSFFDLYLEPVLYGALGVGFIVAGVIAMLMQRKPRQPFAP